jgi:ABC-2 type transport system ATP-binding protein
MSTISLQNISKSYSKNKVLDDISLNLEAGHFYALVGQNGAGKSTLLRILRRLEAPDAGDGFVMGYRLSEDDRDFGLKVGYASEALNFPGWLPLSLFFKKMSPMYPNWDQSIFDQIVSDFGLDTSKSFTTLSRGQRMQACIAFLFGTQPTLLLLDEITAVLDPHIRSVAMNFCDSFVKKGGTVVMATNIVSEANGVADYLIHIEKSKIKFISKIVDIAKLYLKLNKSEGKDHPIFHNPECTEIKMTEKGAYSYLIPRSALSASIPEEFRHTEAVSIEDIFVYLTKKSHESDKS